MTATRVEAPKPRNARHKPLASVSVLEYSLGVQPMGSAVPDSVLLAAMAKRDSLLADAQRWDDFIRMYGEVAGGVIQDAAPRQLKSASRQVAVTGALAETETYVVSILASTGKPLNTRELLHALAAQGYKVGGKEPVSTLSARLSRAPKLQNISGKGWWIKELTGDANPVKETPPAMSERQVDHLTEPQAQGREAGPGGGG
ncbi:MAG: hypothetical protein ACT4OK_06415 [Gemmobacter sp.]